MKRWIRNAAMLACGLSASASWADRPPAPTVAELVPASVAGQNLAVSLAVGPIKMGMLPGEDLGHQAQGSVFCSTPNSATLTELVSRAVVSELFRAANQELKRLGYPLGGLAATSAFDTDVNAAPDFRLGGVIKGYRQETCTLASQSEGWVYFKVDWALYSEKEQRVVFQRSTEGLAQSESKIADLHKRAAAQVVDSFLAAPEVVDALRDAARSAGPIPASALAAPGDAANAAALAPASHGQSMSTGPHWLTLARQTPHPGGASKNQDKLRAAVVVLQTAAGSGSGFYVAGEGYLLTDYHVVKGSKYAKVLLPNGDKLVAQVIKASEHEDVALLKTQPVTLAPLAICEQPLDVGKDVYVIGAPLGVLTSTVTRGVLSADRVLRGRHLLQSDAAVTFGSSGGPLLDSEGRVVGMTVSGLAGGGKGFNFFTPIQDALRVLDIGLGPATTEPVPQAATRTEAALPGPAVPAATAAASAVSNRP